MRLLLTVLGAQRSHLGDQAHHEFDVSGGTLGRSASCDWSLPDPGNTLSARHAAISHNGHGFVVTDTSTNGVYLNGVDSPLGRGQSAPLSSGDSLYISDYVISVTILREAAQPSPLYVPSPAPASSFASMAPAAAPAPFVLPGQAPAASRPADRFGGLSMEDLLGPAPAAAAPPPPMQPAAPYSAPQPAPRQAPPPQARPAQAIPDDFDFSDLAPAGRPAAPPQAPTPFPAAFPAAQPAWPAPAPPAPVSAPLPPMSPMAAMSPMPAPPSVAPAIPAIPDGYAMPGAQPAQPAAPAAALDPLAMLRQRAVARAASIDLSLPGAEAAQPAAAPQRPAIGAVALPGGAGGTMSGGMASGGGDDAAFWEALGLDPSAIPAASRQDVLAELGRALRETASGLVSILSARKSMKDEFRIDQTRLAAHENNPFKFFRSGDEALRRVIAEAKPGYLPLDKAVRQGFADIQAHEVATVIAMQNALRKLLASTAPAMIESGAERGLLGGRPDKGKLWDRYVETHSGLAGDLDRTTREMLADEFARAYAQQTQGQGGEGGR